MTTSLPSWDPPRDGPPRRRPARATVMDRLRVREFAKRLAAGESDLDAFWHVASDTGVGYSRLRGAPRRPPEIVLRRKLAALVERAAPDLVAAARDVAMAQLAGMGDEAARAVREALTGECTEAQGARTRLEAARIVLGSIGVSDRASTGGASADVRNAIQVNVASPSAPRDEDDDDMRFIMKHPDLLVQADELSAAIEAQRERDRLSEPTPADGFERPSEAGTPSP